MHESGAAVFPAGEVCWAIQMMTNRICILLSVLVAGRLPAADDVLSRVAAHAERFGEVSRQIWETPELGFHEDKSSALLQQELRANGFEVRAEVAGMPTAFTASFGSGSRYWW